MFFEITDRGDNFAVAAPCNPDSRACDAAVPPVARDASTDVVVTCAPRAPGPHTADLHITTSAGTRLAAPIALTCTGLAADRPVIAVSPTAVNLGTVEQLNASARTTVRVTNTGIGALQLLAVQIVDSGTGAAPDWTYTARAPCGPTIPATCPLGEAESLDVDLTFDPSAIGLRDATLLINYNDTADRSISVPLRGIGRGATLELVGGATTLDFGTLPLDVTAALTIEVVNRGTRDLVDASAALTPPVAGFAVTASTFTVVPGMPTPITVSCTPTTAGTLAGTLRLVAPDVQTEPINVQLHCTGDPAMKLTATPPAILLGEIRIATEAITQIALASLGGPLALTSAALDLPDPRLSIASLPAMTPAMLELSATPDLEGPLTNHLTITPATGPALSVAITGTAVAAEYAVPAAVSLGTFCVQQPTTTRSVGLVSTGSATLGVAAPSLQRTDSPFDLEQVAPLAYPAELPPLSRALVTVTPKRQTEPGPVSDTLVWTTDIEGPSATAQTTLSAMFVDDGPAVAPTSLTFPGTTIHLDNGKVQPVTLRNCSSSPLQLDPPQIPTPFTIDSPSFPSVLMPGETATFGVGFHPTRLGVVTRELVITSPQLRDTVFIVTLTGEGISDGGGSGSGSVDTDFDSTSFYACGSCATSDASGALALGLAMLCIIAPQHRRRRSRARRAT
jgi:hypothetical protein